MLAAVIASAKSVTETPEEGLKRLRRFAEDELKIQLEAIEGTAAVKVSGGLEDEIQILVDQEKVAQLGLSVQLVAQRIRASVSTGSVSPTGRMRFSSIARKSLAWITRGVLETSSRKTVPLWANSKRPFRRS